MACVIPDGRRGFPLEIDRHRIVQHLARERHDRRRHRRAEEQRLSFRRDVLEHALDVGKKAHVEHAVGFVEHEMFDLVELRVRLLEVIEQAARRGDDDVDARAERVLLRAHADAAEDRRAGDRRVHGDFLELFDDLRRELARRRHDERARRAALVARAVDGGWAAGTRRSLPLPVIAQASTSRPSIAGGIASDLNRSGSGEAELFDAAEQVAVQMK